ncbi:metallophosphoesterase family protein [Caldifermentibacillus hisashii]|uniref:metallophosphoesterase family protein n=1 Tax=Caldifermentibacillus hisashii TaxID=996558 RepID=UPI002E214FC5|nr:metallophosphoesterase family protein [Caldifermentibacillus hisashii]
MYYVFSDVHGCYNEMKELLKLWDRQNEQLIFLGDMVDRGYNSLGVIKAMMNLKKQYGNQVVILKGNHDEMFIDWLYLDPFNRSIHYFNGLHQTIKSFYQLDKKKFQKDTRKQRADYIIKKFPDIVLFIKELPLYYETENCIFVHAGIDLKNTQWKEDKQSLLWIREEFFHSPIKSKKRIFFGHTPTQFLTSNKSNDIWVSKNGDKVGIDGGCVFGGQLNGLKIDKSGEIRAIIKVPRKK